MEEALKKIKAFKGSQKDGVKLMLREAERFTESPISYFATIDEGTQILTMIGWSDSAMEGCSLITKPIVYALKDTGLWGDAVRERTVCIENDYENSKLPTKKGQPEGHVKTVRHMNVPCFASDEPDEIIGVLGVGNKKSTYTPSEGERLQKFGTEAWAVLEKLE